MRQHPPLAAADPADAPAALYVGEVMHARLKPMSHRFQYRVASLLIDLDRLEAADRMSPLFAVNRRALVSFMERDHGHRDGRPLRDFVREKAAERGIDLGGGRVLLLCYPRVLGYTFNPLSVYFAHDARGDLVLIIYEVRNTFGEIHTYSLPVTAAQRSAAGIRQSQDKQFYVSPFIEMAMRYDFRIAPPSEVVKIRILESDVDGPLLAATFFGRRRALASQSLARMMLALPLVTIKVMAAIHWQALKLWVKGARLVPRPAAAPTATRGDGALAG
jgi:DUF1365 family protein